MLNNKGFSTLVQEKLNKLMQNMMEILMKI